MPIVEVTCIEGPRADQRRRLIEQVTTVVATELAVPIESVTVVVSTVPASDWGRGGRLLSDILAAGPEGGPV